LERILALLIIDGYRALGVPKSLEEGTNTQGKFPRPHISLTNTRAQLRMIFEMKESDEDGKECRVSGEENGK
jgi:hypothetical protein